MWLHIKWILVKLSDLSIQTYMTGKNTNREYSRSLFLIFTSKETLFEWFVLGNSKFSPNLGSQPKTFLNPAVTYAAFEYQGRLFWITCRRLKLLRKASRLQMIQNLTPSTILVRQCDIRIDRKVLLLIMCTNITENDITCTLICSLLTAGNMNITKSSTCLT